MRRLSIYETLCFPNPSRMYETFMPIDCPYPVTQISMNVGIYWRLVNEVFEFKSTIKYVKI